jgi:hypothetical protein
MVQWQGGDPLRRRQLPVPLHSSNVAMPGAQNVQGPKKTLPKSIFLRDKSKRASQEECDHYAQPRVQVPRVDAEHLHQTHTQQGSTQEEVGAGCWVHAKPAGARPTHPTL